MLVQMKIAHHKNPPTFFQLALYFCLGFSFSIFLLIIFSSEKNIPQKNSTPKEICKSPECIQLAHQLHNWRDVSVDPCQDFYKFSCGKFKEDTVDETGEHVLAQLIQDFLLKNSISNFKSENSMNLYYRKCQDSENESLLENIAKIGSWPMLDKEWDDSNFNLNDKLSNMASLGITDFGLFNLKVSENRLLRIEIGTSGVDRKAQEKMIYKLLQDNGFVLDYKKIRRDFKNVEKLDLKLAKLIKNPNFQAQLPFSNQKIVNFKRIISNLFNNEESWKLIENRTSISNLTTLDTILQSTSRRTLANFSFLRIFENLKNLESRGPKGAKDCISKTIEAFPLPSFRIFVQNHYDKENLRMLSTMVENIKESFIEMLQGSKWLQEETKKNAIRKFRNLKKIVGYPEEMEHPEALERFYENLEISENDSWLTIQQKMVRFNFGLNLDYISSILPMEPTVRYIGIGAFYKPWENLLVLSVPLLNDSMFHPSYPTYARVTSIGGMIAQEIAHGFDMENRGKDGNGEVGDWWREEDSEEYEKRAQCFEEQFGNLNKTQNLNEFLSTTIALSSSYRTFKKVDFSNEKNIIGFEDYPQDNLFFHLSALNYCRLPESNGKFRMNEVFSIMKEFSEAFNCPVGSPMNPEKKCELF